VYVCVVLVAVVTAQASQAAEAASQAARRGAAGREIGGREDLGKEIEGLKRATEAAWQADGLGGLPRAIMAPPPVDWTKLGFDLTPTRATVRYVRDCLVHGA